MKIEALMESADFEPEGHAGSYVTVTLRVPRATRISPGIYHLEWTGTAGVPFVKPAWAMAHDES
jgi:hypothetical protein